MTTCAKCGAENVAGDAFCGSCGAFLEFAAEEAAEGAQPGVPSAPSAAVETTPPPSPPVPIAPAPPGPTCTACGRVNPAGRRFCISCGSHLPAAASTIVAQGAGSQTSPAGGPSKPAWQFPTAPAPVPTTAVPAAPAVLPAASRAASSGGGSRLPLIGGALVILALLAGAAVLVLGGGPSGGTPGTTASAGASATSGGGPTAAAETPAASEAPSAPPEPTAAPPTIPPGPSVGIPITAAKGSSQLASNRAPKYLYDGSPVTAWMSKAGKLDGAWVEVSFAAAAVTKIQVWTGWQKDKPSFEGNLRPQNVTLAFDGGAPVPVVLLDVLGAQGVAIPPGLGIVGATRLRITIIDTYPSKKTSAAGSPSKVVAISEIRIFGVSAAP